jgi:membrane protein
VSPETGPRKRLSALVRDVAADFGEGDLLTSASAIAFRVLFALLPFLLFVVALLGFLDLTHLWVVNVAPSVAAVLGPPAFAVVDDAVRQVLLQRQGFWLTAGLALTAWELSSAVRAVAAALNRIYGVEDERPFVRWIARSIVLGLAVGALLLLALLGVRLLPGAVEALLGPGTAAAVLGFVAAWGSAAAAMLAAVGLLLRFAPGQRVEWRFAGTGALVTVVAWILASLAFEGYVGGLVSYGSVFGGLALPFILLMYLYLTGLVLLFGVWLERRQRMGVGRPVAAAASARETDD